MVAGRCRILLFVVERRVHGRIDVLVDVAGLREVKDVAVFHNVDAQEALQVVGLRDGELLLEGPAQVIDQSLLRGCDGEVVDVVAEDDLLVLGAELVEDAGVKRGSDVDVGNEVSLRFL